MRRHVTVFGGTGYLGGRIARHLAEAGNRRVRIAARRPGRAIELAGRDGVETVAADVTDAASVRAAIEGSDGVVNAVSLYVQTRDLSFEDIHVLAARDVALAAREAGARLVHISGIGADAGSSQRYVRARGRGEEAVRTAHDGAAVVRPSVMFSEHGGLIDQILTVLRRLPAFPLFGRGETRLQPVHRDDVAAGVARLLETAGPGTHECGGPRVMTYRAIVGDIAAAAEIAARAFPVPFPVWQAGARMAELLPGSPLTRDQVALMRTDNVVDPRLPGLADLGVAPRPLSAALGARFGSAGRSARNA